MSTLTFDPLHHDHVAAKDAIKTIYAACGLAAPRMAFCSSPKAMHVASRMLRQVQAGTAHSMVQAMVRDSDSIEREAKVSLLSMMIDGDVSTQSGALAINLIESVFGSSTFGLRGGPVSSLVWLDFEDTRMPGQTWAPPRFREQVMWPALYQAFSTPKLRALQSNAICIMPFVKLCWLCMPPLYIHTDDHGWLHRVDGPAAAWADGFEIWVNQAGDDDPEKQLRSHIASLMMEAGDGHD